MELLDWQNLIFLLPLLFGAVLPILLSMIGMGEANATDADGDLELDADGDVPAEGVGHAFALLGIGKAPLSILAPTACILFGGVGLIGNLVFGKQWIFATLGASTIVALVGMRLVASLFKKLIPQDKRHHSRLHELWGEQGTTLFSVTQTGGTVRVRDRFNHLLDLECRCYPGEVNIEAGVAVRLDEYDPTQKLYYVRPVSEVLTSSQ